MRETLNLLIHKWLECSSLCTNERYSEHSRETFDAILEMAEQIAEEKFRPLNRQIDVEEPKAEDDRVIVPGSVRDSLRAYAETGLLAAGHDIENGGMQLPYVVDIAANSYFSKASIGLSAYGMLSYANSNLILAHGSETQKRAFAIPTQSGRHFGTMCLSEPQAGSSLADIATRAMADGQGFETDPLGPRYRIKGCKMWISAGEHDLSENIIHLVLARIVDYNGNSQPGVKGLSLFIVPRTLVNEDGLATGVRNDVTLIGLNHKLGYRGTVNTLLGFGEGKHTVQTGSETDSQVSGAVGYLIGQPGAGLALMFHMMNEARLNVGMGAAMLGQAGYEASLEYARQRRQGRLKTPEGKDPTTQPVSLIEHTDVKRMLLMQKSYCTGALALCLYGAKLVDEKKTGTREVAAEATTLLELLTPVAKSWPSQWCLEANSQAIQVLGGYGYTRDFPVEQFWRDNRLNMIHEGTHGIQGVDLLGRKILADKGLGLSVWLKRVEMTVVEARKLASLNANANALADAVALIQNTVRHIAKEERQEIALANSTPFLEAFGHTVIAWIWLELSKCVAVEHAANSESDSNLYKGIQQAGRYFFAYELPKVEAWLGPVVSCNTTCHDMQDLWF